MKSVLVVMSLSYIFIGCASETLVPPPTMPDGAEVVRSTHARLSTAGVSTADLETLAHDNAAFGAALYRHSDRGTGNFIYSPVSVSVALAMTYAGAATETASQMATAMHFTLPASRLHPAFNALDSALNSRGEGAHDVSGNAFQLNVINQLWGQRGFAIEAPFLDTLAEHYGTGLLALDFVGATEPSRMAINTWVEDQTNHRIVDLLPQGSITPDTRLVLTNAVYFNASWNAPFDPVATANESFTTLSGSTVTAPFMHNVLDANYVASDSVQIVELPYDGEEVSMLIVMPEDFNSFEATIDADVLAVAASATLHRVTLSLPKFEARSAFSVRSALETLGMPIAFTEQADFSGIDGAHDLSISDVVHQAFIRVDEHGTEAAAATAVIVGVTSVPQPVTLVVDRPFFFVIRDNATDSIIFAGRVIDPTLAAS